MADIELRSLSKTFGSVVAVDDVSLTVDQGEFLVLLGPSGCGKSTILRLIAGLEDATEGEMLVDGELINFRDPTERNVAMVFQNYALYPHMTVFQNIAFPLETIKVGKAEVLESVTKVAATLDISELLERLPEQLSGGQRQRVALGRAIVRQPKAFLMDEPLSNLDSALRLQTRLELKELHETFGVTTIYVTHDQVEAMTLGHRIAVMKGGRIQQVGPPVAVYDSPANTFVAEFLGSPPMNLIQGELANGAGEFSFAGPGYRLALDPGPLGTRATRLAETIGPVRLGVRPEDLVLAPPGEGEIPGTIRFLEPIGSDLYVDVTVGDQIVRVRTPPRTRARQGDNVSLNFELATAHLFNQEGRNLRWKEVG